MTIRSRLFIVALTALGVAASGCELSATAKGSISLSQDAGLAEAGSADSYPAPHRALPLARSSGGPIVANPIFVPVLFEGDPLSGDLGKFMLELGSSSYWDAVTKEYGVGAATSVPPMLVGAADQPDGVGATLDDDALQTWFKKAAASGVLKGTNGPNTIYAVFLPQDTVSKTTMLGMKLTGCTDFSGYHSNFELDRSSSELDASFAEITYAVVPRCDSLKSATSQVLTGIDAITGPASHELIEAATNPRGSRDAAYAHVNSDDIAWEYVTGGELGDLCLFTPNAYVRPPDFPFVIQRSWSNIASAAGSDPCVPAPTQVFFGSVAELPKTKVAAINSTIRALSLGVGESATVDVALFSDGPTERRWNVRAEDSATFTGGSPSLSFTWDKAQGQNGDRLHLTITMEAAPARFVDSFVIFSSVGGQGSTWMGLVALK